MTDWPIVVLTAALVGVTGYYAWQNARMVEEMGRQLEEMRRQRQLALYQPRVRVLRGVRRALSYTGRDGKVPGETISGLIKATSEKEFLFAKGLCDYLDELYRRCVEASTVYMQYKDLPVGPQRSQLVDKHAELLGWILEQPAELRERFKPYLRVDDAESKT